MERSGIGITSLVLLALSSVGVADLGDLDLFLSVVDPI